MDSRFRGNDIRDKDKEGIMKEIFPGIWTWSWFCEEKGYPFNGLLLIEGDKAVLIDPPLMTEAARAALRRFPPIHAIYLTNKDHERAAHDLRREFKIPLWIHELDKPLLKEEPDHVFTEGRKLECGIRVVHLQHQKSPGESAFYLEKRKTLIVGDALIGHPAGKLNLLPTVKYRDFRKAHVGLRRLFILSFEAMLVGDGQSILSGAQEALEQFFDELR